MNITLINLNSVAVPVSSSQDKGFASLLEPGVPDTFNSEAVTVLNVGDNPTFVEELTEGLQAIIEKLGKLLTFWRDHATPLENGDAQVTVEITNHGPNSLRVLLGVNTNEVEVPVGMPYVAQAAGYVEIRELGV